MALAISDIEIGLTIKFSIYGTIGSTKSFKGEVASKISGRHLPPNSEADINHSNIYPTLPDATKAILEDDYSTYRYLMLVTEEGGTYYIGLPWIIENTIEVVKDRIAQPKIVNFRDEDASRLRAILEQNGYTVDSIPISE